MSAPSSAPHSPTLLPPRKSVELEDPGAHELASSDAEEDTFADAQENRPSHSGPNSPIPTTRVEKVDDRESHGEVPGTAAYKLRGQDAVPDEVEVVPENHHSGHEKQKSRPQTPDVGTNPKTVDDKVDPMSPSHAHVPRTKGHSKRMADAVPDEIRRTASQTDDTTENTTSSNVPQIPTTVITKVDSKPSHGEVPGTEAYNMRTEDARPDVVEKEGDVHSESRSPRLGDAKQRVNGFSPIAADGGFGEMVSDSDDDEDEDEILVAASLAVDAEEAGGDDQESGDDFDDFEAGDDRDDFGDFDEATHTPSIASTAIAGPPQEPPPTQSLPAPDIPFPLLDFAELNSLDDILHATKPYSEHLFPTTKETLSEPPPPLPRSSSVFLTERSHSLWSQLVAPPPLQPPNWVRSRIRRLFLVSLGVPVDLDEILPASKQKKLVLPSVNDRSDSPAPPNGHRAGSRARFKHENASSTSVDKAGSLTRSKRRRGPPTAPELDMQATKMLCATTTAALANMTDEELRAHHQKIKALEIQASEVLAYWLKRRDSALEDKEAFDGVISNLVKHARRVRK